MQEPLEVPAITTEPIQDIGYTNAKSGGKITFNGGGVVTWSRAITNYDHQRPGYI